MKKFNENKILKETKIEPGIQNPGYVTFSQKPDTSNLKKKISGNQGITPKEIADLIKETQDSKVLIFGQEMTKEELGNIPEETIRISKEILEGDVSNYRQLTYLFPDVLKKIIIVRKDAFMELNNVNIITDGQAEILSKQEGGVSLGGLTSISDNQAESLSKNKGDIHLGGLTSISDNQAESLSKHKGDLWLSGLTSISDNQAESLSKHNGKLWLIGLTSISDNQAESLSKYNGSLSLSSLTSINDNQAESLSKHNGGLSLRGLTSISDNQAKSLSKHKGDIRCNSEIEKLINSYKTK